MDVTETAPQPIDVLVVLLTAESLLFAALSIAVVLGEWTERGRALVTSVELYAWAIVAVMTAIAIGAGAAWWDAFFDPRPDGLGGWLETVATISAVVAEVLFALWIALSLRNGD